MGWDLTDDVFEALRGLWLAVENLLDSNTPKSAGENEEKWLKRALHAANCSVDLTRFTPQSAKSPVNAAYADFYDDLRTDLFHAKASRVPSLPAEASRVTEMVERHDRLTRFYLDLLAATTGLQRASGALTFAGFEIMVDPLVSGAELHLTDDDTPFGREDTVINPAGGVTVSASAVRDKDLSRLGRIVLVAEIPGAKVGQLQAIRRFGLVNGGQLMTIATIEGNLELPDVQTLRGQYSIRLNNLQQPKAFVAF